jgi:hypothetical protein
MSEGSQTLESIVSRYRRVDSDSALANAEVELELRFRRIDFFVFKTVYDAFVKNDTKNTGVVSQTINSIMEEEPVARRARHRTSGSDRASLIRQVVFENGSKVRDSYYRKWALMPAYQVRGSALAYVVALSAEEPLEHAFSSDANAIIRIKCRVSFQCSEHPQWRVDFTITRTITGSDARSALANIVKTMFPPGKKVSPSTLLEVLSLDDANSEMRSLYGYEIEIEHVPTSEPKSRDAVRPGQLTELAAIVLGHSSESYFREAAYQAEVYHIATFTVTELGLLRNFEHEWGLKRLVPSVTALTRADYKGMYPPTGYFLLDKADGIRAVASVRKGKLLVLADNLLEYAGSSSELPTIVDGELVRTDDGKPPVFYAFDVVLLRGENYAETGYEVRASQLAAATELLRSYGLDARPKTVIRLTASSPETLKAQFQDPEFSPRPYETDGRILVEPGKPYSSTVSYKWKSSEDTTIDFLARKPSAKTLGKLPYSALPGHELYFLFVGINPDLFSALGLELVPGYRDIFGTKHREQGRGAYFPVQFAPSDSPHAYVYQHPKQHPGGDRFWTENLEGKIVELRCTGDCAAAGNNTLPAWELVRLREDRARELNTGTYFGNDFRTAELTWLNYIDPFTEPQLWEGPSLGYFATPKSAMYRAQTAFTSAVKSYRITNSLAKLPWVVDLASGKGQDLGRYLEAGIGKILFMELDRSAISELIRRKYTYAYTKGRRGRVATVTPPPSARTAVYALQADLSLPFEINSKRAHAVSGFPTTGADAVVCNLALHYFAESVASLRNFAQLCRGIVRVGGTVVLTIMHGGRVHALLRKNKIVQGESWKASNDGVLKYSIRRDFMDNSLTDAGQRVGVLLPFSGGSYYEEFLVNTDTVKKVFRTYGFTVAEDTSFADFLPKFTESNSTTASMLSDVDLTFLGLYGELVFRRTK